MSCYKIGVKIMLKYTSYKDIQSFALKLPFKSYLLYCSLSGSISEKYILNSKHLPLSDFYSCLDGKITQQCLWD